MFKLIVWNLKTKRKLLGLGELLLKLSKYYLKYTKTFVNMSTPPRETIQKQIQQDWANREYIEVITGSIKKITDFLNSFGTLLF